MDGDVCRVKTHAKIKTSFLSEKVEELNPDDVSRDERDETCNAHTRKGAEGRIQGLVDRAGGGDRFHTKNELKHEEKQRQGEPCNDERTERGAFPMPFQKSI